MSPGEQSGPAPSIMEPSAGPLASASTASVVFPGLGDQATVPQDGRFSHNDRALLTVFLRAVQLGPILVLAVFFIAFSIPQPAFFSLHNIQNLVVQSAVVAILGVGQLLVILTAGIDLSVGSLMGLSTAVAVVVTGGNNSLAVIALMLLVGAGAGLVNGIVYVKGKVPHPFIVTLASMGAAQGLALMITNGNVHVGMPAWVVSTGQGFVGPVPVSALIIACVGFVAYLLTRRTQWGRWIYAVGGNPQGARQMGLPVNKVLISVYALSGLSAGVAAIISAGQTNAGDPNAGYGLELFAITAVIIGGASFFGGRGSVVNVIIGALIVGTIENGLDLLSVDPFMQDVAIGVVLFIAVEIDLLRTRAEQRFRLMLTERP